MTAQIVSAGALLGSLPFLRRFARAVTGSQVAGDAAVRRLLDEIEAAAVAPDSKVGLYRALIGHLPGSGSVAETRLAAPDRHLQALTPLSRQAFLLSAVEELTSEEIAIVLDRKPAAVDALLDEGRREIARDLATDVLIIEDEPLIALELEDLVTELGHRLVGVARTREEAVTLARRHRPRLCLADIQLADQSSGIDAVNEILADVPMPVIFITAFPGRFLTGARPEPAFLITKPFDRDEVQAQISQALFFEAHAQRSD